MTKRIIAGLLCLVLLLSAVPVTAFAASTGQQAGVDTGDVSIEGTNGFGTLLSQEITESQTETAEESEDYQAGYTVTDLTIEGTTATVTYDSLEEALLVVALYTEDGMQMLTSATAAVTADATEATVEFTGEMPEYFLASAYLMDTYDLSPLCAAYDTPMYTREMQELLASTVEDYDADRVLNLDDDNTTNFAVYADTTKVIEAVEGVNTVAPIDDENATYVIENADEQITTLTAGDVFVYPYAENEYLIVKVGAIVIDGTTATITGDELEMEEAFSHVKIQGQVSQEDAQIDSSYAGEGVEYLGKSVENNSSYQPMDQGVSNEVVVEFELDIKEDICLTGNLTVKAKVGLEFFVTSSHQRLKLAVDYSLAVGAKVEADISSKPIEIPLVLMTFPVLPGVAVEFVPAFVCSANVTAELTLSFAGTFGIAINHKKGQWDVDNLCTSPDPVLELKVEGTFFAGLQLTPSLELLGGYLVDMDIEGQLGVEVKCTTSVSTENLDEIRHNCDGCLDGEFSRVLKITPSIQFLKSDKLKLETTLVNATVKLFDFYISLSNFDMGFGDCPNIFYKLTVYVVDENKEPVKGALISVNDNTYTTNPNGIAEFYLPSELHFIEVTAGDLYYSAELYMDHARKLTANPTVDGGNTIEFGGVLGEVDPEEIVDPGSVLDSGMCGERVEWILYSSGLLILSGEGPMADYSNSFSNCPPWYSKRSYVKSVRISNGVTALGKYAFAGCYKLDDVEIADGPRSIGDGAFYNCIGLTNIQIPNSVKSIGSNAFYYCSKLNGVVVGNGVTSIGKSAFEACSDLIELTIGDSVSSIGDNAFYNCLNLEKVTIPNSVISIGKSAFYGCESLTRVTIGNSVSEIGDSAFDNCDNLLSIMVDLNNNHYSSDKMGVLFNKEKSILLDVPNGIAGSYTIPDSVVMIGSNAFSDCDRLTGLNISNGVMTMGYHAFANCDALTNITIPESIRLIYNEAFFDCNKLTNVEFLGNAPTMEDYVFHYVTATVYYPANNPTWTDRIMQSYGGNITWVPRTSVVGSVTSIICTNEFASPPDIEIEAVYSGEYNTHITAEYTLKTASFTGLVPSEQYVLLAMKSIEVEDPLASDNLLFIDQGVALEDGTLSFQYVQRESADISYVVACGASNKNLKDAEITFPEMASDGELQVVDPTVVYDGMTLTEGRDYVIVGTVDFTEGGTYTCYIRGIHNYTGLVACEYSVAGAEIASGWSGATTWALTDNGVLTFSGSGNMKNYGYGGGQPWEPYFDRITTVVIEDGVTAVGSGAFRNMTKLESVTLPASGLNKIGEAAFYGCTGLRELYIPDGVYTIWEYTFKNCPALTSIRLPATLVKIDQGAFEACTGLTELFVPGQTEIIGAWSFKGCTGLTAVDMQWADATEIRAGAFKNCTALTDVVLPGDIQILGDSAFYGIGAEAFTVPATVKEVGPWCFARAAVKEVTFEGDAPAIGEGAFNKITLTAFYPRGNATWTADIRQNYGGNVTWKAQ